MNKQEELEIKLNILNIIKDCITPNVLDDTFEISINELIKNIEKIEAQIEVLDSNESIIQSEEATLDIKYDKDETVNKNIIEIISITQYANGKPIMSKKEYKYK